MAALAPFPSSEADLDPSPLLALGLRLLKAKNGISDEFVAAITNITQKKARLEFHLSSQQPEAVKSPQVISSLVQSGGVNNKFTYGSLYSSPQPRGTGVPLAKGDLDMLASFCGNVLHILEEYNWYQSHERFPALPQQCPLTARERDVLSHMQEGYTIRAIADAMCVEATTVITHQRHIYEKLGVHNGKQALSLARKLGLSLHLS